jgi:serine phosphatase RsbU (regulator of sigma subunit)
VDGYDLGALYVSSAVLSGDFHDFIELEDGRVGLLVCDVSGSGVPAALVAATARSYCRSELHRGGDVGEAMRRINRWLVEDVRRGMFVTALYVLIDPRAGQASVACAGHKVPLMRFSAEDGNLRVVHPEGIALGFDRGPVFDQRLEVLQVPVEVGDRLLLANSAPLTITNVQGRELGEKAFFARVLKHARLETTACLKSLRRDLEQYAGRDELPVDVSLVTIARLR